MSLKTTEAVDAVQNMTIIFKVQSVIGLLNVFRRFLHNFAHLAAPLNKRLKIGEHFRFELNVVEREAVNKKKQKLVAPSVLALHQ